MRKYDMKYGGDILKNLKKLRQEANLSQEELAQKAGISRVAISLLERGKSVNPMSSTVKKLSDALNVDPKVLLCNEEYVDITKD